MVVLTWHNEKEERTTTSLDLFHTCRDLKLLESGFDNYSIGHFWADCRQGRANQMCPGKSQHTSRCLLVSWKASFLSAEFSRCKRNHAFSEALPMVYKDR